MTSHYAAYTKEKDGREVIENENGFIVYEIKDDLCYIADIYVIPEKRRRNVASDFAYSVETIAKEKGVKRVLGSVVPTANGATESLKAMLEYGFKLQSSQINFLWLEKDI